MEEFETYLQTFMDTIYGHDMKASLLGCLNILYVKMKEYGEKIQTAESKITELEGGG